MKGLKIIFFDSIDKKLNYPIYELRKKGNNYYELRQAPYILKGNLKEYLINNNSRLCYKITLENQILEEIYKDKVVYLRYVVENNYEFSMDNKEKVYKKQK